MRLNSFALLSLILGVLIPWAVSAGKGAKGSATGYLRRSDAVEVQTQDQRSTGTKHLVWGWLPTHAPKFRNLFKWRNRKDRSSDTSVGMGNGSQDEIGRPSGDDGVAAQGGVMNIEAPVQMPARGSKPKRKSRKGRSLCCFSSSADNNDDRSEAEDRDSRGAMDASSTTPQVKLHEGTNDYFNLAPLHVDSMPNSYNAKNASSWESLTIIVPPTSSGSRRNVRSRIRSMLPSPIRSMFPSRIRSMFPSRIRSMFGHNDGSEAADRESTRVLVDSSTAPRVNLHGGTNKYFIESSSHKMLNPFDAENASSRHRFTSRGSGTSLGSRSMLFDRSSGSAAPRTSESEFVAVRYTEPDGY